jgi:hypothetical protein
MTTWYGALFAPHFVKLDGFSDVADEYGGGEAATTKPSIHVLAPAITMDSHS